MTVCREARLGDRDRKKERKIIIVKKRGAGRKRMGEEGEGRVGGQVEIKQTTQEGALT